MLPTELGGTRSVQFTRRACLTFCSRLGHPALGPLFFSPSCIPANEEAFEVAEWKLIPNHGPLGLPAKIGLMQLIFTQIHLSACSPSLPAPGTKSFGSFLCQFMYSFYPPLSVIFFVNLNWQVIAIIATSISRTYGPSSKWAALVLKVNRSSKKWLHCTMRDTCSRTGYVVVNSTDSGVSLAGF